VSRFSFLTGAVRCSSSESLSMALASRFSRLYKSEAVSLATGSYSRAHRLRSDRSPRVGFRMWPARCSKTSLIHRRSLKTLSRSAMCVRRLSSLVCRAFHRSLCRGRGFAPPRQRSQTTPTKGGRHAGLNTRILTDTRYRWRPSHIWGDLVHMATTPVRRQREWKPGERAENPFASSPHTVRRAPIRVNN